MFLKKLGALFYLLVMEPGIMLLATFPEAVYQQQELPHDRHVGNRVASQQPLVKDP